MSRSLILLILALTTFAALAAASQASALDLLYPEADTKYSTRSTMGCHGKADPGEAVVLEIISGGVTQVRETIIADAKGQWIANVKVPPAGWIPGEARLTVRVGKVQKSVKIKFVKLGGG